MRSWGCSSLLFPCEGWFQLTAVSSPSCRQQASLYMQGHGKAAFPYSVTNSSFIPNSGATDAVLGIKTLHFNSPHHSPSQKFKDRVTSFASHFAEPPVQSASLQVKLVFWLNLIHIQQVALTIFYLPSS